jgi:pentatricopeptide repeat protein
LAVLLQSSHLPNGISYNAAISACETGEQWQQALGLLAMLQQSGLVPDVITYTAALTACERGEQRQQALGLLNVMQQSGLRSNVITYNAAIMAHQWPRLVCLASTSSIFILRKVRDQGFRSVGTCFTLSRGGLFTKEKEKEAEPFSGPTDSMISSTCTHGGHDVYIYLIS